MGQPTTALSDLRAKTRLSIRSMKPDGTPVAIQLRAPSPGTNVEVVGLPGPSAVGTLEGSRFVPFARSEREASGPLAGRWREITAATWTPAGLVWTETASTDLSFDEWSIRALRAPQGSIADIASAPRLRGGARVLATQGGTYPVVIGTWVYWADAQPLVREPDPAKRADWDFVVQGRPLDGASAPEVIAHNAVMPASVGGRLLYAGYAPSDQGTYEIHSVDVTGTRKDTVIARGYRTGTSWVSNLAGGGHWVVWTAQSAQLAKEGWVPGETAPGELFVMDTLTGAVDRIVTQDPMGGYASISFVKDGIVWGSGSSGGDGGEYFFSPATGRLLKIDEYRGLSVVVSNEASSKLCWVSSASTDTVMAWKCGELVPPVA